MKWIVTIPPSILQGSQTWCTVVELYQGDTLVWLSSIHLYACDGIRRDFLDPCSFRDCRWGVCAQQRNLWSPLHPSHFFSSSSVITMQCFLDSRASFDLESLFQLKVGCWLKESVRSHAGGTWCMAVGMKPKRSFLSVFVYDKADPISNWSVID